MTQAVWKKIILLCTFILCSIPGIASGIVRDSLTFDAELSLSSATSDIIRPMWSYSHAWGRYSQYERHEGSLYAKARYGVDDGHLFTLNTGVALQASTDRSRTMLHEAFLGGKIWIFDYTLGREAYTPIDQHDGMGLGTYIMSDNARPIWKAGAGIFKYWAIPGLSNYIEIKGGIYLGKMPDEDSTSFTRNVLLHEKFAYLRIGHFPVKPYLGLLHSVMMGGTLPDGRTIPIDFPASFVAKGSIKMFNAGFEGEYYNAAGAHQGMWDLGIEADFDAIGGSIWYQRPFSDITAINFFDFAGCKDITLGADIKLKRFKPVGRICFEYQTTLWQGGNGPADPTFISTGPVNNGEIVSLTYKEINPDAIRKYFDAGTISVWEAEHGPLDNGGCHDFMVKYANRGWPFGNRTPYLYNGLYLQGWTVSRMSMGWCLPFTNTSMERIAPGYSFPKSFSNLRIRAFSLALRGEIIPRLQYSVKATCSENYGNYREQYHSGFDFDVLRPNYWFTEPKTEWYTSAGLSFKMSHFILFADADYDFGEMYNCFSARAGVRMSVEVWPKK